MEVPAIAAVSATVPRTDSSSLPGAIPEATILADTVAASPKPKLVPFTLASALSMMFCTSDPELPSASSFAVAWSMESRRWKPLCRLAATPPTTAVPAAAAVNFVNLAAAPARPSPTRSTDFFARSASGVKSLGNLIFELADAALSAELARLSVARFALVAPEVSALVLMSRFSTLSADFFTSARSRLTLLRAEDTPSVSIWIRALRVPTSSAIAFS